MKKETKGSKTKEHLYECAIALFKERGYGNVSVDEIVREAGTAKGTFYIYFDSKADVVAHMLQKYDFYYEQIWQGMDPAKSVDERLLELVRASCRFTRDVIGLDLIRVLYANELMGGYAQKDLYTHRVLYRILRDLVEEGQRTGAYCTEQDARLLTDRLARCIRGTFYEWCLRGGEFDLETEGAQFTQTFCRGLRANG